MGNKKGQSVITLTMKDSGRTYLFGSLSAIYGMFDKDVLKITYPALRNAVATYISDHYIPEEQKVKKEEDETKKKRNKMKEEAFSQVIYDTPRSPFLLQRAPLWLLERTDGGE